MRRSFRALGFVLGATVLMPTSALAQLVDAGNQAMIMHNGNMLEQQTAPNNSISNKRIPRNKNTKSSCSVADAKESLRPEYERRVRADGPHAAQAWLQDEATSLGRQAGLRAKAGKC